MANVGLVFGGRSVEHEVSLVSARAVAKALAEAGHEVTPHAIAQDGCWVGPDASAAALWGGIKTIEALGLPVPPTARHLLGSPAEVFFPIVHGTWGEDGTLQGLFEMLDLAYVGAGVAASAVAMDKLLCKRALQAAAVPVVEYRAIRRRDFGPDDTAVFTHFERWPLPLFVKPSVGGSSVGISRVDRHTDLFEATRFAFRFDDTVLIERGIRGRELEVAVLGYRELEASGVGEIVPGNEFYDYEDKYLSDRAQLLAPADLPPETAQRLRSLAVQAFAAIGGSGMARVDFFLEDDDTIYVNEINTLPGFTRISMYPRLWELAGLPPAKLVDRLVQDALDRHADRRRLDDNIKAWLEELAKRS